MKTLHLRPLYVVIAIAALTATLVPTTASAKDPVITDASAYIEETAARAERHEVWRPLVGVGGRFTWMFDKDRSRDPFYDYDAHLLSGILVETQPIEHIIPNDRLLVGLEWQAAGNGSASLFGIPTTLDEHHLYATADYGYELLSLLTPYVRAGAGFAFYDLEVGNTLHAEENWLFTGYAAAGVEIVAKWAIHVGLRTEYGHTFNASPSFVLGGPRDTPEEEEKMATEGTSLGTMSNNGQTFSFTFFLRI